MKNFFIKFSLVGILTTLFFSFFVISSSNVNAGSPSPFDLGKTGLINDTDNRIINKKVIGNKVQDSSLMSVMIPKVFKLAFYLASSLAVMAIIFGGYLMITSLGDQGQHSKGWKVFSFSIVGLVLMLLSRAIVGIVSNLEISRFYAEGEKYSLGGSEYIGNLPSGKIETDVVPQIIQLALQFVSVVIIGIIIYSGIVYITTGEEKKKEMSDLFINAVIGLILILVSYALVAGILKINFG